MSYDFSMHVLDDLVPYVLQRETQVFPTLLLNVAFGPHLGKGLVGTQYVVMRRKDSV